VLCIEVSLETESVAAIIVDDEYELTRVLDFESNREIKSEKIGFRKRQEKT
jgi:hypothetical protein